MDGGFFGRICIVTKHYLFVDMKNRRAKGKGENMRRLFFPFFFSL
jgi:hypothetical protein